MIQSLRTFYRSVDCPEQSCLTHGITELFHNKLPLVNKLDSRRVMSSVHVTLEGTHGIDDLPDTGVSGTEGSQMIRSTYETAAKKAISQTLGSLRVSTNLPGK